jgi:hypothetical protein
VNAGRESRLFASERVPCRTSAEQRKESVASTRFLVAQFHES